MEKKRMVDIHMHVIPAVDDGARSLKESLEMLRLAGAQGVTAVVATSHGEAFDRGYSELVRSRFDELKKAAMDEISSMQLYFGAQLMPRVPAIHPYIFPSVHRMRRWHCRTG